MATRFSIQGAPLISNIGPSVIRTSRVAPTTTVGFSPTIQGLGAGVTSVPGLGLRRSAVITADQIPLGAEIIRIDKPAEYIYHETPPHVEVTKRTVTN